MCRMNELTHEEQKQLLAKVNALYTELIEGNSSSGHKGFIIRTNERLDKLEAVDILLSEDEAEHVKRVYSILNSWKAVLGVVIIIISLLIGIGSLIKTIWELVVR